MKTNQLFLTKSFTAFTLAEVLITLGIIGVVAAMTIPTLINGANDIQFKSAYKKAYADISLAFSQPISEGTMPLRTTQYDADITDEEWTIMKSAFKVSKECTPADLYSCWQNADIVGTCPTTTASSSFIDASGRAWAQFYNLENIYLVDTNGFKGPNKFGKDRWVFTFWKADNTRAVSGPIVKVGIYAASDTMPNKDITTTGHSWCNYPPCPYSTWLYN